MAVLSSADKKNLTAAQQKQVAELKKQWEAANAAGDKAGMEAAHAQAEAIRSSAGYSGGSAGNSYYKQKASAASGGQTAEEVRQWAENYNQTFYDPDKGWVNGYDTAMNTRSKANYIRQQMLANSQAWHGADKETQDYLHQQNVELAKVLADYTGQSEKNYSYDPVTGKWSTWNPNLGYGENKAWTMPNVVQSEKEYLGVTDEDIAKWNSDTSHYFNFVDQSAIRKYADGKYADESSGYTGQYAAYADGPYAAFLSRGTKTGTIKAGDSGLSDYSRDKAPYTENGVILPSVLGSVKKGGVSHSNIGAGGSGSAALSGISGSSGLSGGVYDDYIRQMYDAILQAQLKQLETAYRENISAVDTEQKTVDSTYAAKERQASGEAAQQAAIWRETANAYGLNSGAVGQAALAQGNRLQGQLNGLRSQQAAAQAELMQQKIQLGQQYQAAIEEALAENNYEMANALYEEAVRAEEALQKQAQFKANLALQYAKLAASMMKKKA